ncbi:hypothetical protein Syun_022774 [Stephania yunnanensis]|uniref:Cytochrome P450 n=1 Tax=Stephania yunnanensis TaxID=152371 RepID=A0AAP0FK55_9MAGN
MLVLILWVWIFLSLLAIVAYNVLSFYWLTPRHIRRVMASQGIRGPKPRFLIGNIKEMSSLVATTTCEDMTFIDHNIVGRIIPHYALWSKQYGKRFIFWVGSEPRMCLTDKNMIKEFFIKHNNHSGKSWLQQEGTKHFIGKGVLMANGMDWYHQRQIVTPAFMADKLKNYAEYMVQCTNEMLDYLSEALRSSGSTEVEIGQYMVQVTAEIICRTAFDSSYQKGKQIFETLTQLQHLCSQANQHLYFPGSRFFPNKYNREIKSKKKEMENLLKEIIASRKESIATSHRTDLLSLLLSETNKTKSKKKIDVQMVMDECKTFFFAGHETSSTLLTWTIMLLASNTEWQTRVRAEVLHVLNGQTPLPEQLHKLILLNMVINESMRLYPPAFPFPRMVFEDIRLGDLDIPKGLSIWVPILAINRSEDIWGKDAKEFKPERFADAQTSTPGKLFMPFGMGPRTCIGQAFALREAKIVLALLLSRFSFTISENYRHAPVNVLTLKPKYGVPVHLKPLSS